MHGGPLTRFNYKGNRPLVNLGNASRRPHTLRPSHRRGSPRRPCSPGRQHGRRRACKAPSKASKRRKTPDGAAEGNKRERRNACRPPVATRRGSRPRTEQDRKKRGAPGRIRTCNLRIRSPRLYPLSYGRGGLAYSYSGCNGPASRGRRTRPDGPIAASTARRAPSSDQTCPRIVKNPSGGPNDFRKAPRHRDHIESALIHYPFHDNNLRSSRHEGPTNGAP